MTLLRPRKKAKSTHYPYAVQMSIPRELTPGKMTPLTSVRLIDRKGRRATALETQDSYRAEEWRAARSDEQRRYAAEFKGNPQPWYAFI